MCYIDDQIDSLILCALAPREKIHREVFNIASKSPITLNDFSQCIADNLGVSIPKIKIPVTPVWFAAFLCEHICKPFKINPPLFRRRVGFFTHNRAFDISKAEKHLGYRPQFTEKKGVPATIKYYQDQGVL